MSKLLKEFCTTMVWFHVFTKPGEFCTGHFVYQWFISRVSVSQVLHCFHRISVPKNANWKVISQSKWPSQGSYSEASFLIRYFFHKSTYSWSFFSIRYFFVTSEWNSRSEVKLEKLDVVGISFAFSPLQPTSSLLSFRHRLSGKFFWFTGKTVLSTSPKLHTTYETVTQMDYFSHAKMLVNFRNV